MSERKTVVVTGASDGIGAAAARQLTADGHTVVVVGRSAQKTAAVATELGVRHFTADFTRLSEVRRLAAKLDAALPRIDVLLNNAGGVFGDPARTDDGYEQTLQVNHLAPFLLTSLLLEKLIASKASVIQTSTLRGGLTRNLDVDKLGTNPDHGAIRAYNATKLQNVLFTKELHRRYHDRGLSAAAVYPGNVATNFGSTTTSLVMRFFATNRLSRALLLTSPEVGATHLVRLAEGTAGVDWMSGEFYAGQTPGKRLNPLAGDADLAERLWIQSAELVA